VKIGVTRTAKTLRTGILLKHIKFHIRMWNRVLNQKKLSYSLIQVVEKDEEVVVVVDQEEEETAEVEDDHGQEAEVLMEEEAEVMVL
jgi:translation elongation factor P/translation initiation factor 5A